MKVLIACEFSGIVREAFRKRGHDAWSCDLVSIPCTDCGGTGNFYGRDEDGDYLRCDACEGRGYQGNHLEQDVRPLLNDRMERWDMLIAHPPCTYLTCAQNKWMLPKYADRFPRRKLDQHEAIAFFLEFTRTAIQKVCIENPVGIMSSYYRKPDQIIEPYHYGHDARKKTALWLTGLPKLVPTNIVPVTIHRTKGGNTMSKWHMTCGSAKDKAHRAKLRSITFQGIADAMADQWG